MSLMSKRQQARNEKALQDLLHNVPGNNMCADCQARNPAWASWSLGIFLCMRCAAIHRKLGTHISKVKSLSMDSWTNEQVENMKRVGNVSSNKKYNPQNKKPPVPVDADEADSAMERFIRSKYIQPQTPVNGTKTHNTGSSSEGTPPPLPPKTGGRFFKSATLSFRSKKDSRSPRDSVFGSHDLPRPPRSADSIHSKPSKVFGATLQQDSPETTAQKLTQLRDMGFMDDRRNAMILKGVNGNLEKTVEALVRLGEGGGAPPTLTSRQTMPVSRSLTPQPTAQSMNALSTKSSPPPSRSPTTPSNNPWEITPAQPQSTQSTGTLQNKNPFYNTNPFGMPAQQAGFNLNQSLQNLSLAPSQQPLFPHHTGGVPAQPISQPVYSHSMTPPINQAQNFASLAFNSNQTYPQPVSQPQPQPQQGYNPFLQAPIAPQPLLSVSTSPLQGQFQGQLQGQGPFNSNPFTRSPTRLTSPTLNQIPEQSQQNVYSSPHLTNAGNPFFAMNQPTQTPQPIQQAWYDNPQPVQAPQPVPQPVYYQPQRADTASIMALYNYPHLAPARMQSQETAASNPETNQAASSQPQALASPTPSASNPLPGTKNPFLNGAAASPPAAFASANSGATSNARSRESMTLGLEMSWNNGRHSPDAFASLSARSR
ncbi:putative GTPase activating protein for Arf-domain-containing protein [Biscogniauxia marginata]|nr:putative GTPase activating protein for Arf-domain-containing protein [Biscogniauxia marginata]